MATRLTFDNLPVGTQVTTQYAEFGVIFSGERIALAQGAPSGTNVLRANEPLDDVNIATFVRMRFTSPLKRVRVRAGVISGGAHTATLQAFDSDDNLLITDGPHNVVQNQVSTLFSVTSPLTRIVRAVLLMDGVGASIDDLELDGDPPVPLPTTPPVLQLTSPPQPLLIDVDHGFTASVHIAGRVGGEALMPTITVTIDLPGPPDSQAPATNIQVALAGTGKSRTFAANPQVTLGHSSLVITATNIAGLSTTAAVEVVYLPAAIRERFRRSGGTRAFGALRYGAIDHDRHVAIYARGAISLHGARTAIVLGAVFRKWLSLRDHAVALPRLGAPLSEQRDSLAGSRAQDFTNGRIHSGTPTGSHYVPAIFVTAIDRLGGEADTGVPSGDPTESNNPALRTWMFQQFVRPDRPQFLPSTLEIRGSPPRLYVERQGGYAHELRESGVSSQDLEQELGVREAPTIWYSFACADNNGPCTIVPPASAPPLENTGRYCNGRVYSPERDDDPPQWTAIRGQYRPTPMLGIVKESKRSDSDNPLTHEHTFSTNDPTKFPSDWNVICHPLHPYRNRLGTGQPTLEIEFEEYYGLHFFVGQDGQPRRGDLVFTAGRWIIDCGHDDFSAEIHPPFVLARMHTTNYRSHQATEANIWVNGWFSGDAVEFDIYPPPRPSPNTTLTLEKPVDRDAALDITVDADLAGDHVTARFTASRRRVPVTDAGEMKWQAGRSYEGKWHLYWT